MSSRLSFKICHTCGEEYYGENSSLYCEECKEKVKQEKQDIIDKKRDPNFFIIVKCYECGADIKSKKNCYRLCDDCKIAKYKEKNRLGRELRKKAGTTKYTNRNCPICGCEFNGYQNSKYCSECRIAVNKIKIRNSQKKRYEIDQGFWSKLSEEEKLRRMEIATKKLLEEENDNT